MHTIVLFVLNFVRARNSLKLNEIRIFGLILVFGAFAEDVWFPKGWQKKLPNAENPDMFGFDRFYNGFNHFHMKFDAKDTPDTFEPSCFEGHLGLGTRLRTQFSTYSRFISI